MKPYDKRMPSKINLHYSTLAIILIGAAILRIYGFSEWSLSNDELSAIERLKFKDLDSLIKNGIAIDGHPAFTQLFLFYYTKVFGFSVFVIRLPFVLAGIASCIYLYLFIRSFINKNAALISLSVFAASYFFVLYSQIARPYSLGIFFTLAFHYYWYQFLTLKQNSKSFFLLILFASLGIITHYFASLSIILSLLLGVFYWKQSNYKKYLIACLITALLCSLHWPITIKHLGIGGLSWLPLPDGQFIKSFLKLTYNGMSFWILFILGLPLLAFISKRHQFLNGNAYLLALLFFIPYEIAVYYTVNYSPVLQFSVLLFALPFLIAFGASFFSSNSKPLFISIISVVIFSGMSLQLIITQNFFQEKKFADFKSVSEKIIEWTETYPNQKLLVLSNSNNYQYFNYYLGESSRILENGIQSFPDNKSIAMARDSIYSGNYDGVIIAYANVPMPPNVFEFAREKFPVKADEVKHFNSRASLFLKGKRAKQNVFFTYTFKSQDSTASYQYKGNDEYALTYTEKLSNLIDDDRPYLIFSAEIMAEKTADIHWVFTVDRNDSTIYWKGDNLIDFISHNDWSKIKVVAANQENFLKDDIVKLYFWNPNRIQFSVRNAQINNYINRDYNPYE